MYTKIEGTKDMFLWNDNANWIVGREHIVEKGKSKGEKEMAEVRYFSTLSNALSYLSDYVLKDCETLRDIRAKQDEFKSWIKSELENK